MEVFRQSRLAARYRMGPIFSIVVKLGGRELTSSDVRTKGADLNLEMSVWV
jgi:hypothetical protein